MADLGGRSLGESDYEHLVQPDGLLGIEQPADAPFHQGPGLACACAGDDERVAGSLDGFELWLGEVHVGRDQVALDEVSPR